ncbi:hypothetical protein PMI01_02442 [Caulobacter sp. AP07]|nr:hypothetical protein PMI01_02442 [Caulobacter sp. AP07]
MFPFSVDGRVRLQSARNDDQVLKGVQDRLDATGATWSAIRDGVVIFRMSLVKASNRWNILDPYERGEIRIVRRRDEAWLIYRNSTRRMLAIATGLSLAAGLVAGVIGQDPVLALGVSGAIWLGLFGLNYLIAAARFGGWLSRAA